MNLHDIAIYFSAMFSVSLPLIQPRNFCSLKSKLTGLHSPAMALFSISTKAR
ncbi:hypothetical protein IUY40_14810 [Flavobacterium sp. ALJ2]|uniref:hypothetical protein n=1 Tax=Flavobacterium sp. ALJ2 TaxID=2786960 RepID=UPI00189CF231|nr:hypothetical protein [Flavobacterium sp. ALJ2]MBF7092804.1 hypothetical protein [Flavobacterium sp. ALJ2]